MDMGGDVAGFAELQKALAEHIALPDNRLPFVKAHIFAPSVLGKVLARVGSFASGKARTKSGLGAIITTFSSRWDPALRHGANLSNQRILKG